MIVDTMTFDEVTKYLIKTTFKSDRINGLYKKLISTKGKKYQREMIKWGNNYNHSKYKIFPPTVLKEDLENELVLVPFCCKKKYLDCIYFTTIFYRGKKYVAFKLTDNRVMYFSWHTLKRYSERFLNEMEPVIDNEFIGDMLIYNSGAQPTTYTHNGRETKMFVSTDGGFLGDEYKTCAVANTFISKKEYFSNQEQLDKTAFEQLKTYTKEKYGYWLDRTA